MKDINKVREINKRKRRKEKKRREEKKKNRMESLQLKSIKEILRTLNYEELCEIINSAAELRKEMRKPVLGKRMKAVLKCWFNNFPYLNSLSYTCADVDIIFPLVTEQKDDHSLCQFKVYLESLHNNNYVEQKEEKRENGKKEFVILRFEYNGNRIYQYESVIMLQPHQLRWLQIAIYDLITYYSAYQTEEQIEDWYQQNKDTLQFGQFPKE